MLASIQEIEQILDIPGAEKIELALILGWQVVIEKNKFVAGDLCIYIEIDSLIPRKPWSEFLFEEGSLDQWHRLRTVKRMKQISQGLVIPIESLGISHPSYLKGIDQYTLIVDDDVTDYLGIKKYEKPAPKEQTKQTGRRGGRNFPNFIRKTDEVNIQSAPRLIDALLGKPFYITMKMDGTSFTFFKKDGVFRVCSRNLELLDPTRMTFFQKAKSWI
jgi:RNA ligase (TIGR02306 family)